MKFALATLAAAWFLLASEVWASDISIENDTGRIICELRLAEPGTIDWRDDLLRGVCLERGLARRTPTAAPARADLLAVFEDGDYLVYYGLEIGLFRYLKLGADEAELFEWNPAVGKP